jgi:hypothetical protein
MVRMEDVYQQATGKSNARARRYAAARQHVFRMRRMERNAAALGLTVHTKCACGCGLVIRPSVKRPFAPGHRRFAQGVLRSIRVAPQDVGREDHDKSLGRLLSKVAELASRSA